MVHNVYAANLAWSPAARNVPSKQKQLNSCERIIAEGNDRAMGVLKKAEEKRPGLGLAVLQTFFPERLGDSEAEDWRNARESFNDRQEALERGQSPTAPWTTHGHSKAIANSAIQLPTSPTASTVQPLAIKRSPTIPTSSIELE